MSQKTKILEHLRAGHPLTPLQALNRFGCLTASQRVGELIREGWPIKSTLVKVRAGVTWKWVAEYRLVSE
jgi:hypothetical protein